MKLKFLLLIALFSSTISISQNLKPVEDYMLINAKATDPLYTTYAAPMSRSRLYGDKAYKMDYYSDCRPVTYTSDNAGSIYCIWKVDQVVINKISEYLMKPVVHYSFPDMMIMEYEPFRGIHVKETFIVYSSTIAIVDMEIKNTDRIPHDVAVYPILESGNDSIELMGFNNEHQGYVTQRYESPYRLISSLKTEYGYPTHTRDFFSTNQKIQTYGAYHGSIPEFYNVIKTDYYAAGRSDSLNMKQSGYMNFITLQLKKRLRPGETIDFRVIRGSQAQSENAEAMMKEIDGLKNTLLKPLYDDNLFLFLKIPKIKFQTNAEKLTYIGAFNLARGSMYPASGKTKYNFYAFSRNPLWGWGHGHQVRHESLSMMAYPWMDPQSAQASQRVYREQQDTNGFIAYRHGPRVKQD
ncbi:MAG: hypothetical protein WCL00_07440 [Bacteroidota bacterium]